MRILHTADWHLGDWLGCIDRTADIQRNVEQIARYCHEEAVDVLLIAGDIFSEQITQRTLSNLLDHLRRTFTPFLERGGTIVALTGNHDREIYCETLRHGFALSAPLPRAGTIAPPGRFYFANEPQLLRLADPAGQQVQFVLMPYPTPRRYLVAGRRPRVRAELCQALREAFLGQMEAIRTCSGFDPRLQTVLGAHLSMINDAALFRLSSETDVVIDAASLRGEWAYVALGHIHKAQALPGRPHMRYPGSIEHLDIDERENPVGVLLVEIGPGGLAPRGPKFLDLPARPMCAVEMRVPIEDLLSLRQMYPDAENAITRCRVYFTPGTDEPAAILRTLQQAFPCLYQEPEFFSLNTPPPPPISFDPPANADLRATIVAYIDLSVVDECRRGELINRLDELLDDSDSIAVAGEATSISVTI